MKKDEILEVREYHFKKIKKLCQIYVDREIDYKTVINNSRLIEVCKLIEELKCESERINELEKMLHDCDNKEWLNDKWRTARKVVKCVW